MIPYVWVGLGSALGGVARFGFGQVAARLWGEAFPWGTIAINVLGSFVIGFFGTLTMPEGGLPASPNLRTFVMVGVCGGFTTFSSFSLQTFSLARDGNWFGAIGNIGLSVALCLLAVALGHVSADRIGGGRSEAATMPRTVLAILDRAETAPSVLIAAALAADRLGPARIEALHVRHAAKEGFMPTEDVMTETRRREIDGQAALQSAQLRGIFEAWRTHRGAAGGAGAATPPEATLRTALSQAATWREETGETVRVIVDQAARADLIVIGRPSSGHLGPALHAALFDARMLTLLVPDVAPSVLGLHIVVAWKPGEAANKVTRAALPLLLRADRVTILIGTEEAGDQVVPADLLGKLANTEMHVAVRQFQASSRRIGQALLGEARLAGADLLVMGAYTHNRFVEMVLGGATRDILADADLPVLLQH